MEAQVFTDSRATQEQSVVCEINPTCEKLAYVLSRTDADRVSVNSRNLDEIVDECHGIDHHCPLIYLGLDKLVGVEI